MNITHKYVGYDRYWNFSGIVEILNSYRLPDINVKVKEKKNFKRGLESDVPHIKGYRGVSWWKEDDLISFLSEALPGNDFEAAFKLAYDGETIKRYASIETVTRNIIDLIHRAASEIEMALDPSESVQVRSEHFSEAEQNNDLISYLIDFLPRMSKLRLYHMGYSNRAPRHMQLDTLKKYIDDAKLRGLYDNETVDILNAAPKKEE